MDTQTKIHASIGLEPCATRVSMLGYVIAGNETHEKGGKDQGPTPTELVLSGLATCLATTVRMYADRKEWTLDRVNIDVGIRERHPDSTHTARIESVFHIEGPLTEEQKERQVRIAQKCPIHRLLTREVKIATRRAE